MSSDISTKFQQALAYVQAGGDPSLKKPSQQQMLTYYGLYKQAEKGKCNEKQPSRLNMVARAKWDAWNKLGNMSQEDAKRAYVAELTKSDPTWESKVGKIKAKL